VTLEILWHIGAQLNPTDHKAFRRRSNRSSLIWTHSQSDEASELPLVEALVSKLRGERVAILRVTTTNDNLNAVRFYQHRGFRIARVRPGLINEVRRIEPSIPVVGEYGILIR
jgi:hypothetical protein